MKKLVVLLLVLIAAPARADDPPTKEQLAANRAACERAEPTCDPTLLLSKLERRAIERVLAEDPTLVLDHAPSGKTITKIRVVPLTVFGPEDGFLRFLNVFHIKSKVSAVTNEIQLDAGDTWDQLRVDESARRLRDPVSTGLVAIVPLSAGEGRVELLCVTRDVWSLRMNSSWEFQADKISFAAVALSENNLLGLRKLLALSFRMNLGEFFVGPVYVDKNMFGKHYDLRLRAGPLFGRDSRELEGSESVVDFARPLWSLDTRWGVGLSWNHRFATERSFFGPALRTYDAPETPEDDLLPYAYRMRKMSIAGSVVRAFGDDHWQERARIGYELASQRPELLDGFPDDPVLQQSFVDNVLPRSERTSLLYLGAELFEPRYRNMPNMQSFELAEETRMGLAAELRLGASVRPLGSTTTFFRVTGELGYTGAVGDDGLWAVKTAGTTRIEHGKPIDTTTEAVARFATPIVANTGRLVTQVKVSALFRDTQNQFYTLGGENGLRAYPIGFLTGDRRVIWNTELRSKSRQVWFMRWGVVAYYDVGGTGDRFHDVSAHHDVGVGLRILTPQVNTDVFRIDAAFPVSAGEHPGIYAPPLYGWRISAGYDQTF